MAHGGRCGRVFGCVLEGVGHVAALASHLVPMRSKKKKKKKNDEKGCLLCFQSWAVRI